MIVEGGQFRGQTMSSFTNPGGEVVLRITEALSLSTRAVEGTPDYLCCRPRRSTHS